VQTVSCMSGDPIADGDDPDATPVHDLDTPVLLRMAAGLNAGADLTGHALRGRPQFCLGAMVNPGAEDLDREIGRMEQKAEAGANFFQTQSTYDPLTFERFVARADRLRVPILAGYILPKSGEMARRMNRSLPGVRVPDEVIARLDAAPSNVECAIELSVPILKRLAAASQGLHVIAVGWESRLPQILDAAAITRTTE
jgi:methylenetetrahydrofolate reductase (NADPH)